MNVENDCEGCVANYVTSRCIALTLDDCPCSHCLIKIMCMVVCEDLVEHLRMAKACIRENNLTA